MPRLKVAVRVRPLSQTEKSTDPNSIIKIENQQTITITNVKVPEQNAGDSRERVRRFTFDYCFDENSTQDEVFETVDNIVAKAVKNHQHSCVLAYGQSSSGKTHTMMGTLDDSGITPRLCSKVLDYFEEGVTEQEKSQTRNTVSYLEIYNEKVRDLLTNDQEATIKALKVREHPRKGPYVQGLTEHVIQDEASLVYWLQVGNNSRKVAATSSNPRSSRSHSVFTITGFAGTKLHLIDLAGSERASHLQNSSCRFREGANINKSLVALGNVISVLAEKSSKQGRSYRRFVPYRDSLLTWLLRDTFGGNSTTVMIATISPSSGCYSETVNTLRFGQRAKQIVLQPVVNEDPKERTIRELRAEILRLRELLIERSKINAEIDLESSADFKGETNETITKVDELKLNKSNEENHLANQQPASPTVVTEQLLPLISFTTSLETTNRKMQSITRKSSTSQESLSDVKNEPKTKPKRIPISRRPSEEKVSKPKATLLRSGSDPNNPAKKEKGTVTEIKGPATKLDGNKKSGTVTKPRSAIVAAVTERLYAKVKKKEIATETDRKEDDEEKDVPQELKICSNARLKLQELTQKALRAHRRRNEETQTDMFPVLRVKEIATDVDDLRVALGEIKDAETEPELLEFKSIGIDCTELSTFNNESKGKNNFTVTNTCGTQANEESKKNISFTKYLQEQLPPRYEIINPCNGNPIYTSTVNIHVSHNYINRSDNASEDSLEGQTQQNVFLPTPDLISNHNSLDAQHIHDPSSETSEQHVCESLEESVAPEMCVANCVTIPNFRETVDVDVQKIFVPELCLVGNSEECLVMEEDDLVYQVAKANVENVDEKVVVNDPVILKSIMKPTDSDSSSVTEEAELPDSLKYHQANTAKKVQFKKTQSNLEVDSDRMLKVMSRFLEEATTLLSNLSTAVNKIDNSKYPDSFNLEVSVNDITPLKRMKKRSKRSEMTTVSSTQTLQPETCDFSTNTSDWIPTNKYEKLVEDSCNRLERCIDKAMSIPSSVSRECLHRFPQPFEVWNFEESSGESNPTYSDYGSLPKRSRYAGGEGLRPSAFLRRLTNMRRQVIQDSREQMEQFEANDSEDI